MEIKKADISSFSFGMLNSRDCENLQHIKVLPWLSVVQAVEGHYDIALDKHPTESTGKSGFFITPSGAKQRITHHIDSGSGVMRARWLFLDATLNGSVKPDFLYSFPTILPTEYRDELSEIFDMLFSADDIFQQYIACYRVLAVLLKVAQPKISRSDERMLAAFEYIRKNYMNEIRVEDLAKHLNMSESNLYAAFRKHFCLSPIAYINKFRISVAEEKLKSTNGTIAEIAASVGIGDPLYFNKLFHRDYTISPSEYRKRYKESADFS